MPTELLERIELLHGEQRRPPLLVAHVHHLNLLLSVAVNGLVRDEQGAGHQVLGVGRSVVADWVVTRVVHVVVVMVVVEVVLPVAVVHLVVAHDAHVNAAVEAAQPAAGTVQVRNSRAPALVLASLGRALLFGLALGTGCVFFVCNMGGCRGGDMGGGGGDGGVCGGGLLVLLLAVNVVRRQATVDAAVEATESAEGAVEILYPGAPAGVVLVVLAHLVRLVLYVRTGLVVGLGKLDGFVLVINLGNFDRLHRFGGREVLLLVRLQRPHVLSARLGRHVLLLWRRHCAHVLRRKVGLVWRSHHSLERRLVLFGRQVVFAGRNHGTDTVVRLRRDVILYGRQHGSLWGR